MSLTWVLSFVGRALDSLRSKVESHVIFMDSVFKRNRAFFDEPYILTPEQQQNPISVFHSFFDCMHLHEVRECFNELKEALLVFEPSDCETAPRRSDVIYVFRRVEEFVEAGHVIARKDICASRK
jgi:hypothetical protein